MKNVDLKALIKSNPFILAPMDDVTDIAFRELCEEEGASYSTTELTNVDALIHGKVLKSRYERGKLKVNIAQLFGNNPQKFVEAAKIVGDEADVIDINFGCPSPKVTGNECGSSLLKDPKNVYEIVKALVENIDKPVIAKIRLGYENTNYLDVAKQIERAGASLIAVHGRTAKQKYSGKANWDAIKDIYDNLKIPVVGNGDISSVEDIDKYLGFYCDALMVGRAAIGNPLIFREFNYYLKTGKRFEFNKKEEQKKLFKRYLKKLEKREFRRINIKIQRQAMWFFKGIEGSKNLRKELVEAKNIGEVLKFVEDF